jgi:hypothetical protein
MFAHTAIPTINHNAPIHTERLPSTSLETNESINLYFPSEGALKYALVNPTYVDSETVKHTFDKLKQFIGQPVYPSQLAKALFELAFTDPEHMRLTSKQRTDYMGYLLSNLGYGEAAVIEKLFAFYYGYSFEHFAEKK